MYNSNFRRCYFPCFGAGPWRQQPPYPIKNHTHPSISHGGTCSGCSNHGHDSRRNLRLKCSSFGGIVLPEVMDRETTYNVVSLNLDTSGCEDFCVLLNFSCNITTGISCIHLRFQMFKQEKCQPFAVPLSSGVLYSRTAVERESNSFTLSAGDWDSMGSPCCTYSVCMEAKIHKAPDTAVLGGVGEGNWVPGRVGAGDWLPGSMGLGNWVPESVGLGNGDLGTVGSDNGVPGIVESGSGTPDSRASRYGALGYGLIANPVLVATIMENS